MHRLDCLKGGFLCGLAQGFNEAGSEGNQAGDTICPCLLDASRFIASLSAWRDSISDFAEDSIPKVLGCWAQFPFPSISLGS